jgi:beta-glucuronidase
VVAPGATWTAHPVTTLDHPHVWSLSDPHLYRATLTLGDAKGRRLGGYVTLSGIRTIKVTRDGRLTLNGHLLSLRGVNVHEQTLAEGAALGRASLSKLVDAARALGATMIRAHYPLGPIVEEAADRDGLLLWSEIPVYQVKSANLAQPAVLADAERVLQTNIVENENHPSVAIWSIGNELDTPPPAAEAKYIGAAARLAHRLDPTRPVGMAIASWPGIACQAAYGALDVIGFNDYFGWYDAGGGTTDDRDSLSPYLDFLRACYPTKALLVTEFGFEGNHDGPVDERGTYEFQSEAAAFHLRVFAGKPYLSGALYFALQDFAVTPGWGGGNPFPDPPWHHKGLLDLAGAPKPVWAVVHSAFRAVRQVGPLAPSSVRAVPKL